MSFVCSVGKALLNLVQEAGEEPRKSSGTFNTIRIEIERTVCVYFGDVPDIS